MSHPIDPKLRLVAWRPNTILIDTNGSAICGFCIVDRLLPITTITTVLASDQAILDMLRKGE